MERSDGRYPSEGRFESVSPVEGWCEGSRASKRTQASKMTRAARPLNAPAESGRGAPFPKRAMIPKPTSSGYDLTGPRANSCVLPSLSASSEGERLGR